MAKLIKFSFRNWAIVAGSLACLGLGIGFWLRHDIAEWYWQTIVGPGLEADFGFKLGEQTRYFVGDSGVSIAELTRGGVLESAGLRVGDIVPETICPAPSPQLRFYRALAAAQHDGSVDIYVIRPMISRGVPVPPGVQTERRERIHIDWPARPAAGSS